MKRIEKVWSRLVFMMITLFSGVYAMAQEEAAKVDVNVTKTTETTSNWYANPWIWIVGVAVFILLFAAIVRGGSRSDA